MNKPPLISLSVKFGLVLFVVVACALAIVYLAVVPQLESRLVDAKIRELERAAPAVARQLTEVSDPFSVETIVTLQAEALDTRIVVLRRSRTSSCRSSPTRGSSGPGTSRPTRSRSRRPRPARPASGRIDRDAAYAEVARRSTTARSCSSSRRSRTRSPTSGSSAGA